MRISDWSSDVCSSDLASGKKILLVDDDEALRQSLSEQLHLHEEFDTAEAATGADGIEKAKADYYDLILLDVGLPDMDGREVCQNGREPWTERVLQSM